MVLSIVMAALTAYLLGNLNGAVCMSMLLAHEDVRTKGSGNAGLTNFIRNFGALGGLLVVLIDGGKAAIACLTGGLLLAPYGMYQEGTAIAGLAVMVGHVYPATLGFRGGKGILSALFIAIVVDWRIAVIGLSVFAIAYLLTQYVSLGSVLGALTYCVCFVAFHYDNLVVMLCGLTMSILAIIMHRQNIVRLIKGTERKTNLFGKGEKK